MVVSGDFAAVLSGTTQGRSDMLDCVLGWATRGRQAGQTSTLSPPLTPPRALCED